MQEAQNLFVETPELLAEKRKQEIAAMLLKQLSGGAPQVEKTRILAKQPILGALLNAGGQFLARNDLQRADQRVAEITQAGRQQAQEEYAAAVNEVMTAPDKNSAIAKHIASRNPMVRAMAQAELKALREAQTKEAENRRILREKAAGVLDNAGDTAGSLQVLAQGGEVDPNRQSPARPEPSVGLAPIDPNNPNGPRATVTKNFDKYGRPTISATAPGSVTNVGTSSQKAGLDKLFGAGVDQVVNNAAAAQGAIKLQNTLAELESRSQNGIIDGPATVPLTWITGLARSAGLPVDPKKLADTETFVAFAEEAVQNLIQQMPRGNAGITAPEAQRIKNIMPNAAQSAETRAEIVAILRAANARTVAAYRQSMGGLVEAINTQDPKRANFDEIFLPSALDGGGAPTKTPMNPGAPQKLPGGQTAEVLAERIKIVQAEHDREIDPAVKAALRRELTSLQAQAGQGGAPAVPVVAKPRKQSPAEVQAEIERLERELGMRK